MTQRAELAPGTYQVRHVGTGIATGITVPTLTVAIAQASPSVGQTLTLTTNAAAGAAYQWRAGGVDIGGATAATFNTTGRAAGEVITCRVVSGAQTVTSAGVTLAAGGVTGTWLGASNVASGFAPRNHTAPVSLNAGQKYVLAVLASGNPGAASIITVNGTAATLRGTEPTMDDGLRAQFFDVTPASSGSTVIITELNGGPSPTVIHYIEVSNAATFAGFAVSSATTGNQRVVSLDVGAGDLVIAAAAGTAATGMTWVGATQAGTGAQGTLFTSLAIAGNVAAATPRTVTADRVGTTGGNDGFLAKSVRYS